MKTLKVLSYWNLNIKTKCECSKDRHLKVLSYWNLNLSIIYFLGSSSNLKVLSYWNLNAIEKYSWIDNR